jgi:hypothetical protein
MMMRSSWNLGQISLPARAAEMDLKDSSVPEIMCHQTLWLDYSKEGYHMLSVHCSKPRLHMTGRIA